jgi:hypothetical protein
MAAQALSCLECCMSQINRPRLDQIRKEIAEIAEQDKHYTLNNRTTQAQRNEHAKRILRLQELKAELAGVMRDKAKN